MQALCQVMVAQEGLALSCTAREVPPRRRCCAAAAAAVSCQQQQEVWLWRAATGMGSSSSGLAWGALLLGPLFLRGQGVQQGPPGGPEPIFPPRDPISVRCSNVSGGRLLQQLLLLRCAPRGGPLPWGCSGGVCMSLGPQTGKRETSKLSLLPPLHALRI